ncbi:MAG: hypothetical protein ACRDRL_32360 [Sciscionella sp.]
MTIVGNIHDNAGGFAALRLALEQLIHGEQRAHPIDKSLPPHPGEFGDRKFGGKPPATTVARAIADYCKRARAAALHQHPILVRTATFNAIGN